MSSSLSRRINDHILSQTCSHLADFRSRNGSKPFRALQDCLRVKPPGCRAAIRRDADELPRCSSCRKVAPSRLYACMACAAVSCHVHLDYSHATAHAETMPPGHEIAVDVDRAELFCCACRDQVYDRDFDAAVVLALAAASTLGSPAVNASLTNDASKQLPTPPPPPPENLRKRRRVDYRPWSPDLRERVLMATNSSPLDNTETYSCLDLPQGLRGLNNLGNTCFMNSVLQALLHTPPLRNYFLSDRHNRYFCQAINNAESGSRLNGFSNDGNEANGRKNTRTCLSCDLDAMFSAGFSGDRTPYSPAKFLFSWWQYAANLASYEQQDAHDFFISILDGIHEKLGKDRQKPQSLGNGECCIAHRVFSGILRSDVMCMACGFTSTTYDPCVDISLDLEPTVGKSGKVVTKSNLSCNGEANCTPFSKNGGIATLMGCLDRFTRPEKLGADQKFFCQQCQVRQESLKQMSIRKLPLVSCFHIKRFEHSSVRKMSRKINSYLHFPFSLNMAPYLSSSILRSRLGNRIFPFDDNESDASTDMSSEFELFAIITHTGKLDAGHYVTYLRLSNQWYKCDDAWITQVSENIVRAAQGYMMFYVQKMLYYKAKEKQQAT